MDTATGPGHDAGWAMGNLLDRLRFGHVFTSDLRIWPVFNMADTFIVLGVGLF